jgi:hypothetical protein
MDHTLLENNYSKKCLAIVILADVSVLKVFLQWKITPEEI